MMEDGDLTAKDEDRSLTAKDAKSAKGEGKNAVFMSDCPLSIFLVLF